MSQDNHVETIIAFLFEQVGIELVRGRPFVDILYDELFCRIDEAIGDGIDDATRAAAQNVNGALFIQQRQFGRWLQAQMLSKN
jgi:hypothetical protein